MNKRPYLSPKTQAIALLSVGVLTKASDPPPVNLNPIVNPLTPDDDEPLFPDEEEEP